MSKQNEDDPTGSTEDELAAYDDLVRALQAEGSPSDSLRSHSSVPPSEPARPLSPPSSRCKVGWHAGWGQEAPPSSSWWR